MSFEELHDWASMPDRLILEGVDDENKPLLKQFLVDYVRLTDENINPSCPTCLRSYINQYKTLKSMKTENTCEYQLQSEYNGINLGFNTGIAVTNDNITNEYGKMLSEKFEALGTPLEVIFLRFPALIDPKDTKTSKPKNIALEELKIETKKTDVSAEDLAKSLLLEVKEPIIVSKEVVEDLEA